jgi:biopolymer transport protein ExbD
MKLPRNARIFRGQLDIAPFMGVFLVLLLFVMFQRQLTFMPGIPVALPEAMNLSGIQGPAVTIVMDGAGQLYFDNRLLDAGQPDRLRDILRQANESAGQPVTLIVQADQNVRLGAWMALVVAAREAGIRQVLPAMQPLPAGR